MHPTTRRSFTSLAAGLGALVLAGHAAGQVVTVPPDLSPGDPYRLLFVTDGVTDATSSDIAVYNAFVTADATSVPELAALGTTWFAVASTTTTDARINTGTDPSPPGDTGVPIYLIDGTRLADHYDSLWSSQGVTVGGVPVPDGSISRILTGSGAVPPESGHWTGINRFFQGNSRLGTAAPELGINADGSHPFPLYTWRSYNLLAATNQLPLLCMSDVLTAPSTSFCDASDGSLASCPCGNPGDPDSGCDVAQSTGGVRLDITAQETSPQNRVTFTGTGFPTTSMPAAVVIRASGLDPSAPVVFGDGLRCIGTPLVRLGASFAAGGTSTHTFGHGAGAGPGQFAYQLWFRNTPAMYCDPAAAFNLSNGQTLEW